MHLAAGPSAPLRATGRRALALAAVLVVVLVTLLPFAGPAAGPAAGAADGPTTTAPAPEAGSGGELGYADAVVLGVVEGLTEYLPVSSTGHLLVAGRLLGVDGTDAFDSYAIAIQAGAILAVAGLYHRRIRSVFLGLVGRDDDGRRLAVNLVVAFVPAAVIGVVLEGPIKDRLFAPWAIGAAWAAGGVVILLTETFRRGARFDGRSLEELTVRAAFAVGCCQTFALWPGTSRSLVTILAGLALGLSVTAAVELSFLLGLLTLGAATAYETLGNGSVMIETYGVARPLVGLLAATVSAFVAVRWMIAWLQARGLAVFGWYRLGAAAVLFALLAAGTL